MTLSRKSGILERFMKIGLFTDTYRPSINGIVYVVESLKRHFEAEGHVVYVFCPAQSIRPSKHADILQEDEHIVRFPSVKGAFYEDYDTSIFFPPRVLNRIRDLDLDVIHFFTPSQVGLMGVYAAYKTNTPLVAQHCTDLHEYVGHYPSVLPGVLALMTLIPFTVKFSSKEIADIMTLYRPRLERAEWGRDVVEKVITMLYKKCDAVIALSRKSQHQLESWQTEDKYRYPLTLLPNGVDAIKPPTDQQLAAFRERWAIAPDDEVYGFVGRLGAEKNLALLIEAFELVVRRRPKARLLFVGDFEYRETLESLAQQTGYGSRITFTGALPREDLGVAYAALHIFAFPSLTDTQGWVIHEAAHAGLPILLVDRELSEVVEDGVNGYCVDNSAADMAEKIVSLFADSEKRLAFAEQSRKKAAQFTEKRQVKKLLKLYERTIIEHFSED